MLWNKSKYAEYLFQSWRDEDSKNDESCGPSWFRGHCWVRNPKTNGFHLHDFYYGNFRSRGGFEFCTSDDSEPETVFRKPARQLWSMPFSFPVLELNELSELKDRPAACENARLYLTELQKIVKYWESNKPWLPKKRQSIKHKIKRIPYVNLSHESVVLTCATICSFVTSDFSE